MAAFERLLSQARRHCITRPPCRLSLLCSSTSSSLSSSFSSSKFIGHFRFLCSSSSESKPETPEVQPVESARKRVESVHIETVSYSVKPKDATKSEEELPQPTPQSSSGPPPPQRQRDSRLPTRGTTETRTWTREDFRYVKDGPSISPVSYPARVAPLPDDRVAVSAEEEAPKEEDERLVRERRRIDAAERIRKRVFTVEEETVPFPTLIKVEKKEKQKVIYDLQEAIRQVKTNAKRSFDETVEAHVKLGINTRRTDLAVRGALTLPHGTGKVVRVAVFADGEAASEARAAGADIVGGAELIEEIKNSGAVPKVDLCISSELFMDRVKKISNILRSLMPNPRKGSVTNDVARAVKEAKRGFVEFRMDNTAIVHAGLGK
ncbi:large ribosomal subunit protein uL1c isoform X2 [Malania oleifera]|nr:large ribosomal subunit protein uL1c isoform X2 [Malania oleifera]